MLYEYPVDRCIPFAFNRYVRNRKVQLGSHNMETLVMFVNGF